MKKQFKFLPLAQLKMIEEGPGGFEGYRSVFGELDDAGDIVLPGAYDKFLEQYLTRGFTADTHEWSYGGLIGYPVKANTDDYGLFVASEFHSTEDAQAVRTKIKERMAAGKGVFCSIGYWPWGVKVLYPGQYATELPKVVKADKLQDALARSKQFAKIRLLSEIELAEDSVVPVPALRSAEATEAKGEARGERPEARGEGRHRGDGPAAGGPRPGLEQVRGRHACARVGRRGGRAQREVSQGIFLVRRVGL